MLSRVHSAGLRGVDGFPVVVELDLAGGLPGFSTVGLPDNAVREARERVASAVRNSGFEFPRRRITVNLAPALSRKQGTHYDLPIALAVLSASGQLPAEGWPGRYCFLGELALDGRLRPVPGVLSMAQRAREQGFDAVVVPPENAAEAAAVGLRVLAPRSLRELAEFLAGRAAEPRSDGPAAESRAADAGEAGDLADVRGQALAKRALEIAAAGGHNLLLIGPPGAGKSMLARRLPALLPPLSPGEALEVTRVRSALGEASGGLASRRPFRAPHHSASASALIGGGPACRPGEASLAHGGVLFLDELAEFARPALEALRQPLEDGFVQVARARESLRYPARFCLVAATNPCPCGWRGHPRRECVCGPAAVRRYLGRLSGPLLDRVDLQVELAPVDFADWSAPAGGESSAQVRERVLAARALQRERFAREDFALNAYLPASELRRRCSLEPEAQAALAAAAGKLELSARSLDRALKVARTIADLAGRERVAAGHVAEALQYRAVDRLARMS